MVITIIRTGILLTAIPPERTTVKIQNLPYIIMIYPEIGCQQAMRSREHIMQETLAPLRIKTGITAI
jgi:hypothetical protein